MMSKQDKIKEKRYYLTNRLQWLNEQRDIINKELKELCYTCKHDGLKTASQSASGNEYFMICGICGGEV